MDVFHRGHRVGDFDGEAVVEAGYYVVEVAYSEAAIPRGLNCSLN